MLFKGTTHRSAEDIARSVDSVGGNLDAFTGKEQSASTRRSWTSTSPSLDVLADLVLNPRFAEADVEKEKGVILEEIKMEATPGLPGPRDLLLQLLERHSLGKPILGTRETVGRFDSASVRGYYSTCIRPPTW